MKRISYILFFAATTALSVGCKKSYLELKPFDEVAADIAIQTEGDMQAATNGIYSALRSSTLYGRDIQLRGDVMADNVFISTTNSNRFLEYQNLSYTTLSGSVSNTWNNSYAAILRANNVINSAITANATTNQYRGEALTLRALLYHDLVRQFAKTYTAATAATDWGVPLVLTYDPTLKPARNSVQEVYDQIEKDLKDAIPLLTQRSTYSAAYINKNVAKALLARVYLYKNDWANALSNAEDVINNGGYSLTTTTNHVSYWSLGTARTDKTESMFELVFDPTGNAGLESMPYFFLQAGYGDALAANSFFNTFSATDVRRNLMIDVVRGGNNVKAINKYPSNINYTIKVVRLAEVYLTAAEAAYHANDAAKALTYLNYVATRRDANFAGYASAGTQLLEDILTERRKELAFEGFRYWDLQRYNRDVVRVNVNGNYAANVPLTFAKDNYRRILPIPQTEADANVNIRAQQNEGY